jgi:hypothetical protein
MDMWADEEGMLVDEPRVNWRATAIAHLFQVAMPRQFRQEYVGTVVILGNDYKACDSASLSLPTLAWLQETLRRLDEALDPCASLDDDTDAEDDDGDEGDADGGGDDRNEGTS